MRKCIRSRLPTPTVSKAHNFFSRGDNLLNFVILYTLECWLQYQVDRKSFHNVSNFTYNVNLPLAWPHSAFEPTSKSKQWIFVTHHRRGIPSKGSFTIIDIYESVHSVR